MEQALSRLRLGGNPSSIQVLAYLKLFYLIPANTDALCDQSDLGTAFP